MSLEEEPGSPVTSLDTVLHLHGDPIQSVHIKARSLSLKKEAASMIQIPDTGRVKQRWLL